MITLRHFAAAIAETAIGQRHDIGLCTITGACRAPARFRRRRAPPARGSGGDMRLIAMAVSPSRCSSPIYKSSVFSPRSADPHPGARRQSAKAQVGRRLAPGVQLAAQGDNRRAIALHLARRRADRAKQHRAAFTRTARVASGGARRCAQNIPQPASACCSCTAGNSRCSAAAATGTTSANHHRRGSDTVSSSFTVIYTQDARRCTAAAASHPNRMGGWIDNGMPPAGNRQPAMARRRHSRIQSAIAGLCAGFKPLIAMTKPPPTAPRPATPQ